MGNNIDLPPTVGKVATDEVVDPILGTVQMQIVKIADGTPDGTSKMLVSETGAASTFNDETRRMAELQYMQQLAQLHNDLDPRRAIDFTNFRGFR